MRQVEIDGAHRDGEQQPPEPQSLTARCRSNTTRWPLVPNLISQAGFHLARKGRPRGNVKIGADKAVEDPDDSDDAHDPEPDARGNMQAVMQHVDKGDQVLLGDREGAPFALAEDLSSGRLDEHLVEADLVMISSRGIMLGRDTRALRLSGLDDKRNPGGDDARIKFLDGFGDFRGRQDRAARLGPRTALGSARRRGSVSKARMLPVSPATVRKTAMASPK